MLWNRNFSCKNSSSSEIKVSFLLSDGGGDAIVFDFSSGDCKKVDKYCEIKCTNLLKNGLVMWFRGSKLVVVLDSPFCIYLSNVQDDAE